MTSRAPTQSDRVTRLEQWVIDHEKRCEERLGEIKTLIWWVIKSALGVAFMLLCWTLTQLWTANQQHLADLQKPPVTVVQSQH